MFESVVNNSQQEGIAGLCYNDVRTAKSSVDPYYSLNWNQSVYTLSENTLLIILLQMYQLERTKKCRLLLSNAAHFRIQIPLCCRRLVESQPINRPRPFHLLRRTKTSLTAVSHSQLFQPMSSRVFPRYFLFYYYSSTRGLLGDGWYDSSIGFFNYLLNWISKTCLIGLKSNR